MNITKKILSVVSVLCFFSQYALAEMQLIDDEELSNVSGQKGLA
jgi:hypothetical protein